MNQAGSDSQQVPRVWVLTGQKAGDNAQVIALADALGWPYEVKRFRYKTYELITNRLLGRTIVETSVEYDSLTRLYRLHRRTENRTRRPEDPSLDLEVRRSTKSLHGFPRIRPRIDWRIASESREDRSTSVGAPVSSRTRRARPWCVRT